MLAHLHWVRRKDWHRGAPTETEEFLKSRRWPNFGRVDFGLDAARWGHFSYRRARGGVGPCKSSQYWQGIRVLPVFILWRWAQRRRGLIQHEIPEGKLLVGVLNQSKIEQRVQRFEVRNIKHDHQNRTATNQRGSRRHSGRSRRIGRRRRYIGPARGDLLHVHQHLPQRGLGIRGLPLRSRLLRLLLLCAVWYVLVVSRRGRGFLGALAEQPTSEIG